MEWSIILSYRDKIPSETHSYYSGNYDLTEVLGFEKLMGYSTVLCYKVQSKKNYNAPLEDIGIVIGDRRKDSKGGYRTHINLNKNYECIKKHFGRKEGNERFLTYKRGKSLFEKKFMPQIIDRYPSSATKDTDSAIAMVNF